MHFTNPGRIKVFLKDANKKDILTIGKEVLVLWATKKEIPMYYFKHLYKKGISNYRDFISPGEVNRIKGSENLHKLEYISILDNKLSFALYCQENAVPSPALISHNFGSRFYFDGRMSKISQKEEMVSFFNQVFESEERDSLFFRPLALNGGQGCFKLDRDTLAEQLEAEYGHLLDGDYTHTEVMAQHPAVNHIYDKSINTLRILTFIDEDGVDIISAFIRIGAGGSVVDNGSSGGLFVGIDQESGRLKATAYRDLKFGGGEFERHPDTGFVFEDFEVPFFKEACQVARDAAKRIPNRFIGWDIGITPTGPTVIEGNEYPDLFMSDVAYGGLLKNSHMKKVLASI